MALSLDGHANNVQTAGTSGTVTLTTASANDIIVVVACAETSAAGTLPAVQSISDNSGQGLTYVARKVFNNVFAGQPTKQTLEVWWALAPSAFSAAVITVNWTAAVDDVCFFAFGVNGANTSSPWDVNGSLPATAVGSSTGAPSVAAVSTTAANTMVIAACASGYVLTTQTAGTVGGVSANLIDSQTNPGGTFQESGGVEQLIVSGAQSGATVNFGTSYGTGWLMYADAIRAAGAGSIIVPWPLLRGRRVI